MGIGGVGGPTVKQMIGSTLERKPIQPDTSEAIKESQRVVEEKSAAIKQELKSRSVNAQGTISAQNEAMGLPGAKLDTTA